MLLLLRHVSANNISHPQADSCHKVADLLCVNSLLEDGYFIISRNMLEVQLYTLISTDVQIVGNKYILIYIYRTEDVRIQVSLVKKTTVHGLHRTVISLGWMEICPLPS